MLQRPSRSNRHGELCKIGLTRHKNFQIFARTIEKDCVCVCVCVREREREREKGSLPKAAQRLVQNFILSFPRFDVCKEMLKLQQMQMSNQI